MEEFKRNEFKVAKKLEQLLPYYKEGYDGFLMMKYMSQYKYQQEFLDGKLFFNTSDYFSKTDKKGQGDETENLAWQINNASHEYYAANLVMKNGIPIIEIKNYSVEPKDYRESTISSYSPAEYRKRKLISFYTIYTDSIRNRIDPFSEKMEQEFGEYGVLIIDTIEFYRRVINGLLCTPETVDLPQLGYVYYLKPDKEKGLIEYSPFIKTSSFSYQNEFRITFVGDDESEKKIDIGASLRDIAFPVYKEDYKEFYMEKGLFNYPLYS